MPIKYDRNLKKEDERKEKIFFQILSILHLNLKYILKLIHCWCNIVYWAHKHFRKIFYTRIKTLTISSKQIKT